MSCSNYVPGSFAPDGTIDSQLNDDVALGPMLNILVNTKGNELDRDSLLQSQRRPEVDRNLFNCWA